MALTVKSRRERSASTASENCTCGLAGVRVVGLGPVGRDLEVPRRRSGSRWCRTARPGSTPTSAQPLTSFFVSSGRASVVRSMSRPVAHVATEQQVAHDAADQVEPVTARVRSARRGARVRSRTGRRRSGITGGEATGGRGHPRSGWGRGVGRSGALPSDDRVDDLTAGTPARRRLGTMGTSDEGAQRRPRCSRPGPRGRSRLRGTRRTARSERRPGAHG